MADREKLAREWIELSGPWIKEAREGENPTREGLLDAPVLEECGNVTGLTVLDLGCGEGRFCRILGNRGAGHVIGLDLCGLMIEAAKKLQTENDEYWKGDAQDLGCIPDEIIDLAVSYLNQCDLPDMDANNREVFRVLRPGGRFIVANVHPMRSALGGWHKDESGRKLHARVDNYFDEGERQWKMMGCVFTNYHRTLETNIRSFTDAGFRISGIREPSVTQENLKKYPGLEDELRVPNFIIFTLQKG
jgi:ubiquinone/menaquinone biosynthesis C-methylase UbiE